MKKHTLGFVVLGCIASACASTTSAGGGTETTPSSEQPVEETKYEIAIARPASVGQKVRVSLKAMETIQAFAEDDTTTAIDLEGITQDRQLEIAGILEILEVDEYGQAARAEMLVEQFYDALGEREVLPPGSKMLVTRDGDDFAVVVDGKLPSEDLVGWLALAFPQGRPGGIMVGDALAPDSPKAVGETWEVAKDEVTSNLIEDGYETAETHVSGEVTLVGTSTCGNTECLELSGSLRAEEATFTETFEATVLEAGVVEGKARLLLPMDTDQPVFLEDGESTAIFVAKVRNEAENTADSAQIQVKRRRVASYVPAS